MTCQLPDMIDSVDFFAFLIPSKKVKNDPQSPENVSPCIASILAPRENHKQFRTYLIWFSPLVHVLIIRSLFIKHQTHTILIGFQCSSCSRIRVKFEAPGARKIYEALLSLFIASERDLGTKSLSFTHDTVIHLRKCTLQRGLIVQENLL